MSTEFPTGSHRPLLARVVQKGRLLPLLSVVSMAVSVVVWLLGGAWIVCALVAIYLLVMQMALETTGW